MWRAYLDSTLYEAQKHMMACLELLVIMAIGKESYIEIKQGVS